MGAIHGLGNAQGEFGRALVLKAGTDWKLASKTGKRPRGKAKAIADSNGRGTETVAGECVERLILVPRGFIASARCLCKNINFKKYHHKDGL